MTAIELDAEREVDLARWRRAVAALWWLPVAGLVAGAILGVLYSFRGGNTYKASALISLGQPVSPGGVLVNGYGTNPRAVSQIVGSAAAQERAAKIDADARRDADQALQHARAEAVRLGEEARREAAERGRRYVEEHHTEEQLLARWDRVFESVLAR
jgi:hypothetical protein